MADSQYWADQTARKVLQKHPRKKNYVVAIGVTPSGRKHIGNYREAITNGLVAKSLVDLGKKVTFMLYWDDYDPFRDIPQDLSPTQKKKLKKYLGAPVREVPDVLGKYKSWASRWEDILEKEVNSTGFKPKIVRNYEYYKKCKFAKLFRTIMQERKKIAEILNRSRKEPYPDNWYPLNVYCEKCNSTAKVTDYDEDYTITYDCKCGHKAKANFSKKGIVKPTYRADLAVRWVYFGTNFEAAGKDHMVKGSSWDRAGDIVREVFKQRPPYAIMYDFVRLKGLGGKMSSSKGNVITVEDALKVYPPEIFRHFFASTKPNREFSIPFDEEIIKAYEDFYETERIYYGQTKLTGSRRKHMNRVYEMSLLSKPAKKIPKQLSFRQAIELMNIYKDINKAAKTAGKDRRTKEVLTNAGNWLEIYAPDKYKFTINTAVPKVKISKAEKAALNELGTKLEKKNYSEKALFSEFGKIADKHEISRRDFFKVAYKVLVSRDRGPRLAPFILAIGKNKIGKLFSKV